MNKIIKSSNTTKKSLSDFESINQYINTKFSDIDVSHIPIYMATPEDMDSCGFGGAGGFFVPHMRVVVVKSKITIGGHKKPKLKFDQVLQESVKTDVDPEDVIVHEMIHAVSSESGRSNRKFSSDEEEFVYTNSIDFYKQKNMTSEDIVNGIFFPFCVQDVFKSTKELESIMLEVSTKFGIKTPPIDSSLTNEKLNRFLGRYAEQIVPIVIKKARDIGFHMIKLYEEFGRGIGAVCQSQVSDTGRSIFFDDDE